MGTEEKENFIYKAINYFYWIFMSNVIFMILNIPALFLLYFVAPARGLNPSILEIYLCCLPIGPAFVALVGVMGKLHREKFVDLATDFIKMYKMNFKQGFFIWCIHLGILIVLGVDVITSKGIVKMGYTILFMNALLLIFYMYPIMSRFHMKLRDLVVLSLTESIKNIKVSIIILIIMSVCFMIFMNNAAISFLFMASSFAYILMFYMKGILMKLELQSQQ